MQKGEQTSKILKILQTQNVIEINDSEIFKNEGKSYLEFAMQYGSGNMNKNTSQDHFKKIDQEDEGNGKSAWENGQKANIESNLELCLQKS